MGKIEWSPALSVGVESIDQEHQKLISICNNLVASVKGDMNVKIITESFKELRAYTVYHFSNEEKFQEKINFPESIVQAQEHAKLKKDVKIFQQSLYNISVRLRKGLTSESDN